MSPHTLTFHPDGTAETLWTDALPLAELGRCRVRRASWIEWHETAQVWEVFFAPPAARNDAVRPPALFWNASRAVCLAWEHTYFNA